MPASSRFSDLANLVERFSNGDGIHPTAVPGLQCLKISAPNSVTPSVYQPSICIVVQGSKTVLLEGETYRYAPSEYLAVSVDLPLLGQVRDASPKNPICACRSISTRIR